MRPSLRENNQLRKVSTTLNFSLHAEGSVLIEFGDTKVLCNASVEEKIPPWLKGQGKGWVTAEYGMLPRSTNTRMAREAKTKQSGRSQEIQRLIGRSLRAAVDLTLLGERQIIVDCDVIQADGGTRTAAITGAYIALNLAINLLIKKNKLKINPIIKQIAAISVGIYKGKAVLDLDYLEDSSCETDMNVVMTSDIDLVEIQGTAEKEPFSFEQLQLMLALAKKGIKELIIIQNQALATIHEDSFSN